MKKNKLCIFLILLLVFSGWSCQRKEGDPEAIRRSRVEKSGKGIESEVLTTESFVYDSQGKRDPFVPLEGAEEGPKFVWLSLEGILWKPERPLAIINDQIVSKGDIVQGAEVIDIKEDGVILRYGEEQSILRLKK